MSHSSTLTSVPTPSAAPVPPRWRERARVRAVVAPVMSDSVGGRHRSVGASQLLWHERVVTATSGYLQLTIPLVGRHDRDLGRQLAAHLDRVWTNQPTPGGERITSVSAIIGKRAGQSLLILFLSLDGAPTGRRIDDSRMARHLRTAMQQLTPARPRR